MKIEKCKLSVKTTNQILENIEDSQINRLALVEANLNKSEMQPLINLIVNSSSLLELDVSWNQLSPAKMANIFGALASNRGLEAVNVSWNKIQGAKFGDPEKLILADLETFLRKNKNLIKFDMSYTWMTNDFIKPVIQCLNESKSLLVLDISQNT